MSLFTNPVEEIPEIVMILPDTGILPDAAPRPTPRLVAGTHPQGAASQSSFQSIFAVASGIVATFSTEDGIEVATPDIPDLPTSEPDQASVLEPDVPDLAAQTLMGDQAGGHPIDQAEDTDDPAIDRDPVLVSAMPKPALLQPDLDQRGPVSAASENPILWDKTTVTAPIGPVVPVDPSGQSSAFNEPSVAETRPANPHLASPHQADPRQADPSQAEPLKAHAQTLAAPAPVTAAPLQPTSDSAPSITPLQVAPSPKIRPESWPAAWPTPPNARQTNAAPLATGGPVPSADTLALPANPEPAAMPVRASVPPDVLDHALVPDHHRAQSGTHQNTIASGPGASPDIASWQDMPVAVPKGGAAQTDAPHSVPASAPAQIVARPMLSQPIQAKAPSPQTPATSPEPETLTLTDRRPVPDVAPPTFASASLQPASHPSLYAPPAMIPAAPPVQTVPAFPPEITIDSQIFVSDPAENPEFRPAAEGTSPSRGLQDILHRPELPRHVSAQLLATIQRGPTEKNLELTLNPAELGRVRISLTPGDAGIVVTIVAERPETLDLMRRNVDTLAQDFLGLGYGRAEFNFGQTPQRSGQGGRAGGPMLGDDVASGPPADDAAAPTLAHITTDRVDIRL